MKRLSLFAVLAVFGVAAVCVPAASASDSLASPTPLAFGVPQVEDTSGYGVEGEPNTGAPFTQSCDVGRPVGVARTAWFTVQGNGAPVTVSTAGSSFDTAMFIYSGSPAGALVTCSDDGPGTGVFASATFTTTAGATYAVQAGRFCNADPVSACTPPPTAGTLSIVATTPAAAPTASTGQRAAALKKCKQKKQRLDLTKKAFKKCKQRAQRLPL